MECLQNCMPRLNHIPRPIDVDLRRRQQAQPEHGELSLEIPPSTPASTEVIPRPRSASMGKGKGAGSCRPGETAG
eukprot:4583650-Prymnesium_polylepis.1